MIEDLPEEEKDSILTALGIALGSSFLLKHFDNSRVKICRMIMSIPYSTRKKIKSFDFYENAFYYANIEVFINGVFYGIYNMIIEKFI